MAKRRKKQAASSQSTGLTDIAASDYNTWLVFYKSKIHGPHVAYVPLKNSQPKANQAFWGLVQMTGAQRMSLLREPEGDLTEPQLVYWLERMRVVYTMMTGLINNPKEPRHVHETAKAARERALYIGRNISEKLKAENPDNPALKETLIPKTLDNVQQWLKLEELRPKGI